MKFLVIGASGQVGGSIYRWLRAKENLCVGTYFQHGMPASPEENLLPLDISDRKAVKDIIADNNPEVIFLPAAHTNVDQCQETPRDTEKINILGPKNVVDAAGARQIVFFSTDFVFNGQEGHYDEDALPDPINAYGFQKLMAEHYIMSNAVDYKIIRTNVVYGPEMQGKNFVTRLIENLRKGNEATIPKDEYGTPTYGPELAAFAIKLAASSHPNGIYHVSGNQLVNRYKFALEAAKVFDCDVRLVKPIVSSDLKRPALRPLNAGLQSKKVDQLSGYVEGLRKMKVSYENF